VSWCRQQALIEVPVERIWALVGDVRRHPEWWPRIVDVQCEELEQGCTFRQVTKRPIGTIETDLLIERLEDCREVKLRCLDTGTCSTWLLTDTREGTFIDVELGMDPKNLPARAIDAVAGRRFFRKWLAESLASLRHAAGERRDLAA
jgi:Polyketide cyclase / dehydrase and lipid transport